MTLLRSSSSFVIILGAAIVLFGESFKPDDVKILGDLEYGQSSDPVEYSGTPRYSAFIFTAKAGDRIEATAKDTERKAFVAIADGTLQQLAAGTTRVEFVIPNHGPDAEAYYIVFRDSEGKPARFTVGLKRLGTNSTPGD